MNYQNDHYSKLIHNKILYKFKLSKVDSYTIIEKCERIDKNRDRLIHVDDLEQIIQSLLGENRLTMREMIFLLSSITHNKRRGLVIYDHMNNFFETEPYANHDKQHEKWRNDSDAEEKMLPKGSIGEFLQKSACPAEIKNFKKFIAMIESYEKSTGLIATTSKDGGIIVPLGPDLRVSVEFFMG